MDIENLFGNKKLITILNCLINNSGQEITQKQVIKEAKISKATAVKWTKFLIKNQLINKKKIGVSYLLSVNDNNILIKELKKIKILSELDDIKELKTLDYEIYLYGSCARGEYCKDSDIDLLIIGNCKRNDLINSIENISKNIKKKISFKIFTNMEWSRMQKNDKAFYDRVEEDKVRLV